jgi:hypothetical protein
MNYRNPKSPGYARRYKKGERCIGDPRCTRPAGCAWGPWCFEHNVERMDRISASFEHLAKALHR